MENKRKSQFSPKKSKRLCTFQECWIKNDKYEKWLQKVSEYDVRCLLCNIQFTIKYEGVKGIKNIQKQQII
jgi:hypothetical protein